MVALLVGVDFHVGQTRCVVDADVHVIPAGALAAVAAGAATEDSVPGAATDPAQFLDVDVDQLAGPLALVAVGRLDRLKPRELAQADAGQHGRDRGKRHRQTQRDLRGSHPQPAQGGDQLDAFLRRAMRNRIGSGGAVQQPGPALIAIAPYPLGARAVADSGGLGRLRQRPVLPEHPLGHRQATLRAERRVSVNLHPVSSLELTGLSTCQPPRRPGWS